MPRLVQKEMYPGVAPRVDVYAPLGSDLLGHLARINGFNSRGEQPTAWRLEVHTGPDFLERMLAERPGNVVVISGRNRGKIDRIVPIGRGGSQRARGQAVDSPFCRLAGARARARRRRRQGRRRVRHHDRALRGHHARSSARS